MDKLPAMPPDPETEIQDLTRDECRVIVDYEDYAALRSVALAYLEALTKYGQHTMECAKRSRINSAPDRPACDCGWASLGKLPERAP